MLKVITLLLVAALFSQPAVARDAPGRIDVEASELGAELIGAPVFSNDGVEVGQVTYVIVDERNQPERLFIMTDSVLGFGPRVLEVPSGSFMLLRGAVVLRLSAHALPTLPEPAAPQR